jgi:hypothetical protein
MPPERQIQVMVFAAKSQFVWPGVFWSERNSRKRKLKGLKIEFLSNILSNARL